MHTRRIVLNVATRDSRAEQGQIRDVVGQVRHAIFFICIHTVAGAGTHTHTHAYVRTCARIPTHLMLHTY